MKKLLCISCFLLTSFCYSQIKGTVTDENGLTLPSVSVFMENSFKGTTTNDAGKYELNTTKIGSYTLIFQSLGYKSKRINVQIAALPHRVDVVLEAENIALQEIVINKKENPANIIIRNTIAARKTNSAIMQAYQADFYSRGIFRIKNAPRRVLGTKLDMFDDQLDSTRSGILYLSETVSKLAFQKPDKLKETIIASKVSGNDNGYSFNNAASVNFDFYDNTIPLSTNVISPIASSAFNYYRYKLEGTFFDENNRLINKIKVTPKRKTEPVVEGYVYIVDDSYALYGVDLIVLGANIQSPAINVLQIKQQFSYNAAANVWAKTTQTLDFLAGALGINISGRFTYVYSNFEFPSTFQKKTFGPEILVFEQDANKKADDFWEEIRPVPLTEEEVNDYDIKGKLQEKKNAKPYLDSLDNIRNKFKVANILNGYTFTNSFRQQSFNYKGILKGIHFNTVQGYVLSTGISATQRHVDKRTYTIVGANFDYGFSEDRFRSVGFISRKFNNINDLELSAAGGSSVEQFNADKPISDLINTIVTGFFRYNYIKLYDRDFVGFSYRQEISNGIQLKLSAEYNWRKPLFNTTDESIINNHQVYTSNNPLAPADFTSSAFESHRLAKAQVSTRINFKQQYWTRPDGRFTLRNSKYPTLFLSYEKGFAANENTYHFDHVMARIYYDFYLSNKGLLGVNLRGGKFYNASEISFIDYKHFNGNLTYVGQTDRYLNVFNLMPYYAFSTNEQYAELHVEYNDNGYFMNKVPLLNKLRYTLVLGAHVAAQPAIKPYSEYSIGLDNVGAGKVRLFRIDYVRSYQNGLFIDQGVIVGLKLLNLLE